MKKCSSSAESADFKADYTCHSIAVFYLLCSEGVGPFISLGVFCGNTEVYSAKKYKKVEASSHRLDNVD